MGLLVTMPVMRETAWIDPRPSTLLSRIKAVKAVIEK